MPSLSCVCVCVCVCVPQFTVRRQQNRFAWQLRIFLISRVGHRRDKIMLTFTMLEIGTRRITEISPFLTD
jgi:hypothetical protein